MLCRPLISTNSTPSLFRPSTSSPKSSASTNSTAISFDNNNTIHNDPLSHNQSPLSSTDTISHRLHLDNLAQQQQQLTSWSTSSPQEYLYRFFSDPKSLQSTFSGVTQSPLYRYQHVQQENGKSSLFQVVSTVYPEYEWQRWRLDSFQWGSFLGNDVRKQRKYLDWVSARNGLERLEDWYNFTIADIFGE